MKKAICIGIIFLATCALGTGILFFARGETEFAPGEDEIALLIHMNTAEDIGLLVYDYSANGAPQSGGISNADRSLIGREDTLILSWNRQDLQCDSDSVELTVQFRIITEYVDPNFENIYPESITKALNPISFTAQFEKAYSFTITGDRQDGYQIAPCENG